MGRINNKVALITGASQGIGAETARLFVQEGATVILTDILDDKGEALAAELGDNACYYHLDVANEPEWQHITAIINERFGRLDILFNNAGITGLGDDYGPQDPENASLTSWQSVMQINLDSVFLGCKYGIQLMKAHGGAIINMSSRSGIVGVPGTSAYAASKAAIRNHTKSVALYCAEKKYRIRCNSIHPGAVMTPIWDPMLGETEAERKQNLSTLTAGIPLGHMGTPQDVAYAVLYLGCHESAYMTGAELVLDGGILAGSSASPQQED